MHDSFWGRPNGTPSLQPEAAGYTDTTPFQVQLPTPECDPKPAGTPRPLGRATSLRQLDAAIPGESEPGSFIPRVDLGAACSNVARLAKQMERSGWDVDITRLERHDEVVFQMADSREEPDQHCFMLPVLSPEEVDEGSVFGELRQPGRETETGCFDLSALKEFEKPSGAVSSTAFPLCTSQKACSTCSEGLEQGFKPPMVRAMRPTIQARADAHEVDNDIAAAKAVNGVLML